MPITMSHKLFFMRSECSYEVRFLPTFEASRANFSPFMDPFLKFCYVKMLNLLHNIINK